MSFGVTALEDDTRCGMRPRERSDASLVTVVPILRSGILAREFCRHRADAEVAAVFERSLYLRSGDLFVCLGEPTIGNGPLTLIAEPGPDRQLSQLGLHRGRPVSISDGVIAVGNSVRFTFDQCESWRPPRWPVRPDHRGLREIGDTLASLIATDAPEEGLARASCPTECGTGETKLARAVRERLARLTSWLGDALAPDRGPPLATADAIVGLIGLGPGLTPSGDDFLVGVLAVLDALAERKAHAALAGAIAASPCGLTSPLSECLLRAAAAGHVGEKLHCAVSALLSGAPGRAVAAIRNIGHSSGWDMLAGAAIVLRAVAARS